ncbi:MAG TPA: aldo/keto reductase [Ktedonobacterales bacterium]|jgi:aryl-alcohol dehydrogenase-like predicted oxidoreductase|nr:aldo/keto reductase [Ktedonobacterales bacterium]
MEYRRLGASGLRVSVIGLGGNTFGRYVDERGTAEIVAAAFDAGINFFDTADVYGAGVSERYLGAALRGQRERALIATKVGMRMGSGPNESGSSRKHIFSGVHESLKRLDTDYIDLLQIHAFDPETPLEETLDALNDLVRAGSVRYIGCSNYDAWRLAQALWISDKHHWAAFVSTQPEYNLLSREIERELIPACLEFGVGVIPYFPLAAGVLTGKYQPGQPAPENTRGHNNPNFAARLNRADLETAQRLDAWARERDHTVAELALAWLAAQPSVATVISGVRSAEQVAANARSGEWKLSAGDLEAIEDILKLHPEPSA